MAKVDHKTVGKIRREILGGEFPSERTVLFKDRHGNHSEMQVRSSAPPATTSLVQDLLRTISDEDLMTECRRRDLQVEVTDDPL